MRALHPSGRLASLTPILSTSSIFSIVSLVSALALTTIAGCGSTRETTSSSTGDPPEPTPKTHALYGAREATTLVPFPSNRYTIADSTPTGLRVSIGADTTSDTAVLAYPEVVKQLSELDGFSTAGGVIAGFDGPIDIHGIVKDEAADPPVTDPPRDALEYTLPDSPFLLVDVDPQSPERGKAHGLLPRWWAQAKDSYYPTDDYTLVAQPATPLLPGTRYLFVVTNKLKDPEGLPIGRTLETDALLGWGEGVYGEEVRAAVAEMEKSVGVNGNDVVLATTFTTASILDPTLALGKRARAAAAPPLLDPWTVETPMSADGRIRFRATFGAPEYRDIKTDRKWHLGGDGAPVEQAKVGLEVFLAFADGKKSGPRPVVIFAHGLGGDKDGCWGTAERLASLGAAVIAIDSPEHGSRGAPGGSALTATLAYFGVDSAANTFDIQKARDNFRQMTSDQLELVRFINSLGALDLLPAGAPDGVPDLDVSRIYYLGHSFGSVQGASIFALAPEIRAAAWNVGGDGLMSLIRDSGLFSLLAKSLAPPHTPDGAMGRFFAMSQAIIDPGDPLNYARFGALTPTPGVTGWIPRDMLVQEVIDDGIVPNSTTDALARAAGMTLIDPIRPISGLPSGKGPLSGNAKGATAVISQYDKMDGMTAEHGGLIFSAEAKAQYLEFFKTAIAGGPATVPPAYPGKP